MPRDKTASYERIVAAAKKEFMKCGYQKASMRQIGSRAGLTAAGIYRHCRNKEDLFEQIVSSAVEDLDQWMEQHIMESYVFLSRESENLWKTTWVDMMRDLIYPRMDEYRLLLTRAQGTRYENFLHDLVASNQQHMLVAFDTLKAQGRPVREVTDHQLHLLLSGYITAIFEPVIHNYSLEEALQCLDTLEAFFIPGWKQIMGF